MTVLAAQTRPIVQGTKVRRRRRLIAVLLGITTFVVIVIGLLGAAWYFSDQLLDAPGAPASYDVTVLARTAGTVTLSRVSGFANSGRFGLVWPGGRTIVGPAIRMTGTTITRRLLRPAPGLLPGRHVLYDNFVFTTPRSVRLPYHTLSYPDPLGPMPAWLVPGRGSTWVIAVHGLGNNRREPIRPMPALASLGLPILDIGYRNDVGAPAAPDHLYHLGASEWIDLQSAVRFALSHGAHAVVLYGYSMGGNIIETFMAHSPLASRVRAIVLDAPALDWYQILELAAEERDLPGAFAALVERLVAWRIGLFSLDAIDPVLLHFPTIRPTLIFQGTADSLVPPASNREFAEKYPRVVRFVRFPGADHIQSWNVDPTRYDRVLVSFVRDHLRCRSLHRVFTCT